MLRIRDVLIGYYADLYPQIRTIGSGSGRPTIYGSGSSIVVPAFLLPDSGLWESFILYLFTVQDHPYDPSKDSILRRAKGMYSAEDLK